MSVKRYGTVLIYSLALVLFASAVACVAPETGPDTPAARVGAGFERTGAYISETPAPNPTNPLEILAYAVGGLAAAFGTAKGAQRMVNKDRDKKYKTPPA